ncbi:RNA polymerase sigma factor SigM [Glycomyces sp. TRM65418]|uniref:RNA polymerase sigma factor SigM n=1 Tax=Glycomyces sp. TRM65418 TaxID=2867006 RepID=UPI001CE51E77|nr:RNA polymerase sigma factor SigM [Glycomyces sp. TRM65418]MCC3764119.1 RNA polymerase sigma factor SigM [Glycomyces sp. TRM65418]QZD53807.1 RNA polymerase sigma factor SigM [Glycomyces sp. TRM65418]
MPAPSAPGPPAGSDAAPDCPSDAELLRRHVGGDREAFGELFRRHRGRLWAVAVRTLADPEDAAEAVQDAMIKAYQGAGSFRGTAAVTTWLHRIVVNACLDRIRASGRRPTVPLADEARAVPAASDPATDPQQVALRLSVHRALADLPFDQRAVLVYVDMLGYPVEEVAAVLKIRPGTVKSRASRARKRLAARLPDLDPATDGAAPGAAGDEGPAAAGNPPRQLGVEPGAPHRSGTVDEGRGEGNR